MADAWTVFRVLTGELAPPPLAPAAASALRLAVPRPYFFDMLDDDVRARFEASLEAFRAAGVRVREIEIPHTETIANVYIRISLKEAAAYHAATLAAVPERYTPPVRQRLEMGRNIQHEEYMLALGGREQLRRDVDAALADCDALALPTLPIPAPKIGAETVQVGADRTAAAQRDAAPDAAVQHHRPPGHLHPVRPHAGGPAVRAAARRRAGPDARALVRTALACEAAHREGAM